MTDFVCVLRTEIVPLEVPFERNFLTRVFFSTTHRFSSFELALHNGPSVCVCVCVKKCYLLSSTFVQRKWVSHLFFNLFLLFSCENDGQIVAKRQTTQRGGGQHCSNFHPQFPPSDPQVTSCCDRMRIKKSF